MLIYLIIKETRFRKKALARRRKKDKITILQYIIKEVTPIKSRAEIMDILVPSKYKKHQMTYEEIEIIVRQMVEEGLVDLSPEGMAITEKGKTFIESNTEKK